MSSSESKYINTADLYDKFIRTDFDIAFWLEAAKQTDDSCGSILELMCGTGRVTLPLLKAGHHVTALDNSKEFLAILRDKVSAEDKLEKNIEIVNADVRSFQLDGRTFSRVMIPFHAFAELTTKEDQQDALTAIRKHLSASDGKFICSLHNPAIRSGSVDGLLRVVDRFPSGDGGSLVFSMSQNYLSSSLERSSSSDNSNRIVRTLQFYEEYDQRDRLISKRFMENRFSLITYDEFAEMVKGAGFKIDAVYGDYENGRFDANSSPFMIWHLSCAPVCRKKINQLVAIAAMSDED